MFLLSGTGDLIEPDEGDHRHRLGRRLRAGRGQGAGRGTPRSTPREIAEHAMTIAAEICIYTNANITIEEL